KDDWDWEPAPKDTALIEKIRALAESDFNEAYRLKSKAARSQRLDEIHAKVKQACVDVEDNPADANVVGGILHDMEAKIVRGQIPAGRGAHGRAPRAPLPPHPAPPAAAAGRAGLGALPPGRDATDRHHRAGSGPGRADHRPAAGRFPRAFHAPLQLPAVLHRR